MKTHRSPAKKEQVRQAVVIQAWGFGRNFLENEQNESVIWRKAAGCIVASEKIWAFQVLEF